MVAVDGGRQEGSVISRREGRAWNLSRAFPCQFTTFGWTPCSIWEITLYRHFLVVSPLFSFSALLSMPIMRPARRTSRTNWPRIGSRRFKRYVKRLTSAEDISPQTFLIICGEIPQLMGLEGSLGGQLTRWRASSRAVLKKFLC